MELRHLRYFMAAAEEQHFGRAAERLNVTRPAVSQLVADLESELGIALFERMPQQIRLTTAGRALLPQLHAVMDDLNEALAMARRVGHGEAGSLTVGYGSLTLLNKVFRAAIKRFHETYPAVTLSLVEMPTSAQPQALADGRIQAGFMHFGPEPPFQTRKRGAGNTVQVETVLDWFPIQTGGLGVAVPHDHRLAQQASVSLADLVDEGFVVVPQSASSPGFGLLYAFCQKAGFVPRIVQEVSSITSQLNLISVGMGIGITVIGRNFSYPDSLVVIPLHEVDYRMNFVFGWVKGQHDPVLERMLDVVKAVAREQ
ncbi:LysR family transcriptional regulator [Xylophilus sp. GOD-11R]|uniref:LysR family transcriptional regulator n=1 Tax=Xylophilus sp. GOD-11R TaxID=3089814 RepID=UPI00298BE40E|nr:LysR substrate-binding domain-containing protein [Xylophilus sp. GOD-11R]WPB55890.1 LysR substrate-binding domain-containing protein [Xylophilus sp. GOD-11R]